MTSPQNLIPHLRLHDPARALEFYQTVFGAQEVTRHCAADGRVLTLTLKIDKALLILDHEPADHRGDSSAAACSAKTPTLHLNVASCDAAIERAVQAGATVTLPPRDMFWGERYGTITDPFGQVWSFSQRLSAEEPAAAVENPPADRPWGHAAA